MKEYIGLNRTLRAIRERLSDARHSDDAEVYIVDYIKRDVRELRLLWPQGLVDKVLSALENLLEETKVDWWSIDKIISEAEDLVDGFFIKQPSPDMKTILKELLHPSVEEVAFSHYLSGNFREAVLNSVIAVFDMLRDKSGLDLDGAALVTQALSIDSPIVKLADITKISGRNVQIGFIDMLKGAYTGIRNPKAHSLNVDLNATSAAQYLVFASLLARILDSAARTA